MDDLINFSIMFYELFNSEIFPSGLLPFQESRMIQLTDQFISRDFDESHFSFFPEGVDSPSPPVLPFGLFNSWPMTDSINSSIIPPARERRVDSRKLFTIVRALETRLKSFAHREIGGHRTVARRSLRDAVWFWRGRTGGTARPAGPMVNS